MKSIFYILALVTTAMSDSHDVLKTANNQFTAQLLQEVVNAHKDTSVVLSAFSVLTPLAQLMLASEGETRNEISSVIGLPNDKVIKEVFTDYNTRLQSIKGVEVHQANKIYVRDDWKLDDKFAASSKAIFNSEVQNINFHQADNAIKEINDWVEAHTDKCITNLLSPRDIADDTVSVLVNALHFDGKWAYRFYASNTKDSYFHVTNEKAVSVPMMNAIFQSDYKESQELDAKVLQLNYKGYEAAFVVVLPNEIDGINGLLNKIKDTSIFSKFFDDMSLKVVNVTLPKFKIETSIDLIEVLKKRNINKLFQVGNREITKLLKESDNFYISTAIQKTFINVNEEGTQAAAATSALIGFGSSSVLPEIETFNADHPFVFFILEKKNILFSGIYRS